MKLDISLAWRHASAAVSANREVLLALAGVFFLLPRLAFQLFAPEPPSAAGGADEAFVAAMQVYYGQIAPIMLPMIVVEATGTLAMLTLFTDRSKPTVGQAIALGGKSVLPYLAVQVLFAIGVGLGGGVLMGIAAATGVQALAALVVVAVIVAAFYGFLRLVLAAPAIAVERIRQPIAAMRRSWSLTQGNASRIFLFLALLMLVLMVVMGAAVSIAGAAIGALAGPEAARVAAAIISSALSAGFAVYLSGCIAAIHRQLAGPSAGAIGATFE